MKPLYYHNFDANDWFIVICILLSYAIAFRLPRAFPRPLTALVALFGITLAKSADHTLGIKPLDFYDTNEIPVFDAADLATWLLYPVAAYLFVYAYHRMRIRGLWHTAFILAGAIGAAGFELLCLAFHVFSYKEWTLAYSFVVYLVSQSLTIAFFRIAKRSYLAAKGRFRS